ncbi:MAG: L-histidine N(alpha)-methyltransferase [Pseudomonadota bacterium]|nr:L-histidine N(alpha)-methyltransferase [Pseudomonadota bacterium]
MRLPSFIQLHREDAPALRAEAIAGLKAPVAALSPKFFYDQLGSTLFDAITAVDEYYPTRTEAAIFDAHAAAMAQAVHQRIGTGATLVDLGAGNCAKAARLFGPLQPESYVAVDISADFLQEALTRLQREHPQMSLTGVGLDFSSRLTLPPGLVIGPAVVFYPGSSIGNFNPDQALKLLRQAHALSNGGALLIGVDLLKSVEQLEAAYDDGLGVTAAFDLNVLRHLNRLIGSDFDVRQWRHRARFNEAQSRIEMHLHTRKALTVRWPGGERRFAADESIHTESSYKWKRGDFEALLRDAGFRHVQAWTDAQDWFAVLLADAG